MTFRIDTGADLSDLFGGQTDFEVAVYVYDEDGEFLDIAGAGHTVTQAVAEARKTIRAWHRLEQGYNADAVGHLMGFSS